MTSNPSTDTSTDSSTGPTSDASPKRRPIKLGFVINDMATEKNNYTTIRLARTAINRGHEVQPVRRHQGCRVQSQSPFRPTASRHRCPNAPLPP